MMILKEVLAFYSFVDSHTTARMRHQEIFNHSKVFCIKFEEVGSKSAKNSTTLEPTPPDIMRITLSFKANPTLTHG